jgi:hypothetical protein
LFITRGTTKSRPTFGPQYIAYAEYADNVAGKPGPYHRPVNYPYASTDGIQITESDGNRWPPPKGGRLQDFGSEFFSRKTDVVTGTFPHHVLYFGPNPGGDPAFYRVSGNFLLANGFASTPNASVPDKLNWLGGGKRLSMFPVVVDSSSSRSQLVTKGTIAVAATSPGNQVANAASSIGELLQDVPSVPGISLWKSRLRALETLAATGDEFLNVVFGITPTISDIHTFLKGVDKVDRRVDQFIRDSGRVVRRKFAFPKEVTTSDTLLTGVYSPVGAGIDSASGKAFNSVSTPLSGLPCYETWRTRTTEREIWFSGAFTYHLPDWYETGNRESRRLLMAKFLGAQPDLNTLWQLTPWSWAVDWFSNASSYVKNLQSLISYGTVLRYGYVMEKTTVTDTYRAGAMLASPLYPTYIGGTFPAVAPVTVRTTVQKRVQANPFGFGLSWDGLSTVQQAIVAALGITRVVR